MIWACLCRNVPKSRNSIKFMTRTYGSWEKCYGGAAALSPKMKKYFVMSFTHMSSNSDSCGPNQFFGEDKAINFYFSRDLDQKKVDEFNICHEDAECLNTEASYQCDCNEGFLGDGKTSCQDIDECDLGLHTCHPMATCQNNEGAYECSCLSERQWRGNGRVCSQDPVSRWDGIILWQFTSQPKRN